MADIIEMPVRSYRDLRVWQSAKALVLLVYKITNSFPKEETYGLTAQMRRAAVSLPSNIAEGNAKSTRDYLRFIDIAQGSLAELETQTEIAYELGYMHETKFSEIFVLTDSIGRMLTRLSQSLKSKQP